MNRSSGRSAAFRFAMGAGLWRRSKTAFQGAFGSPDVQSVLLLAVAAALLGLLLSLIGAMHLPDIGGSAELQTLSAADPCLQTNA
jgi:hypothetical protein